MTGDALPNGPRRGRLSTVGRPVHAGLEIGAGPGRPGRRGERSEAILSARLGEAGAVVTLASPDRSARQDGGNGLAAVAFEGDRPSDRLCRAKSIKAWFARSMTAKAGRDSG